MQLQELCTATAPSMEPPLLILQLHACIKQSNQTPKHMLLLLLQKKRCRGACCPKSRMPLQVLVLKNLEVKHMLSLLRTGWTPGPILLVAAMLCSA